MIIGTFQKLGLVKQSVSSVESKQTLWYPKAITTEEVGYFVENKDIY